MPDSPMVQFSRNCRQDVRHPASFDSRCRDALRMNRQVPSRAPRMDATGRADSRTRSFEPASAVREAQRMTSTATRKEPRETIEKHLSAIRWGLGVVRDGLPSWIQPLDATSGPPVTTSKFAGPSLDREDRLRDDAHSSVSGARASQNMVHVAAASESIDIAVVRRVKPIQRGGRPVAGVPRTRTR